MQITSNMLSSIHVSFSFQNKSSAPARGAHGAPGNSTTCRRCHGSQGARWMERVWRSFRWKEFEPRGMVQRKRMSQIHSGELMRLLEIRRSRCPSHVMQRQTFQASDVGKSRGKKSWVHPSQTHHANAAFTHSSGGWTFVGIFLVERPCS